MVNLDLHSDSIDLHGNLSTIWNIHLTDSDGTSAHNNIMLGGGRDAWIYYNATDLIIDPDVVGDGDVIILGDIIADNLIGKCFWNKWDIYRECIGKLVQRKIQLDNRHVV